MMQGLAFAKHPTNTSLLLVGTTTGLYVSDTTQLHFSIMPSTAGFYVSYISVSASGLWVVGGGSALYVSQNSGTSWTLHQFPDTQTIAIVDPKIPNRIVVGASATDINFYHDSLPGLYASDDSGATFTRVSTSLLPSDQIQDLSLYPPNNATYLISLYSSNGGIIQAVIPVNC
jgi:hypothetical protein